MHLPKMNTHHWSKYVHKNAYSSIHDRENYNYLKHHWIKGAKDMVVYIDSVEWDFKQQMRKI